MPKSKTNYWAEKFRRNLERDREHQKALRKAGWHVRIVWECETKDLKRLERKCRNWLRDNKREY